MNIRQRRELFARRNKGANVPDTDTYEVVRYFQGDEPNRVIATGQTLEEAQAHCNDPQTSSSTATDPEMVALTDEFGAWFDGYRSE